MKLPKFSNYAIFDSKLHLILNDRAGVSEIYTFINEKFSEKESRFKIKPIEKIICFNDYRLDTTTNRFTIAHKYMFKCNNIKRKTSRFGLHGNSSPDMNGAGCEDIPYIDLGGMVPVCAEHRIDEYKFKFIYQYKIYEIGVDGITELCEHEISANDTLYSIASVGETMFISHTNGGTVCLSSYRDGNKIGTQRFEGLVEGTDFSAILNS